jgi:hypothetical protein
MQITLEQDEIIEIRKQLGAIWQIYFAKEDMDRDLKFMNAHDILRSYFGFGEE